MKLTKIAQMAHVHRPPAKVRSLRRVRSRIGWPPRAASRRCHASVAIIAESVYRFKMSKQPLTYGFMKEFTQPGGTR